MSPDVRAGQGKTSSAALREPRFGTDGVRGVANEDLTAPFALKLGIAAASVLMDSGSRSGAQGHVVVGRDTRLSGDMLEAALSAGLAATGCHVTNVGVVPTPAMSHIVVRLRASAGAIISASHNPYPDNGIKFIGPDGRKLPDDIERRIAAALENVEAVPRPTGPHIGRITDAAWHGRSSYEQAPVLGYIAHVAATAGAPLDGLKLVLDCANGATSAIAPGLFTDLGAEVVALCAEPDGVNINLKCGSTSPERMCSTVVETGADAGLAFDGDGDRVMMCDETGAIVDGDRMMAVCALGMQRRGELVGDRVVATIMSNAGLDVILEEHGIALSRTDVGDRYVAEEMERCGAVLGGEQSGHLLFSKLTRTGDGMLSGLQVLKEMRVSGKPLSALASVMPQYPQLLRNVRVSDRLAWQNVGEITDAIGEARARLGKPEWLSVRASGTEPVVRVMAQGADEALVSRTVEDLCAMIARHAGAG
ncbi:MAG: phosphoglucosamine mutase [Chthonomonadales bacterium]|nr:phosphoglucosamine mutase [Chthonomonadales bacterium]